MVGLQSLCLKTFFIRLYLHECNIFCPPPPLCNWFVHLLLGIKAWVQSPCLEVVWRLHQASLLSGLMAFMKIWFYVFVISQKHSSSRLNWIARWYGIGYVTPNIFPNQTLVTQGEMVWTTDTPRHLTIWSGSTFLCVVHQCAMQG